MGAPTIIATMLMMGLVLTLLPGAIKLKQAMDDANEAWATEQRDMAFCARHPTYNGPPCDVLNGSAFQCVQDVQGQWHCKAMPQPSPPIPSTNP